MYYRFPCLFFRNTVRSASSCFRVRQDHYGARGLWLDHLMLRDSPDHSVLWDPRGLARPLRALGLLARPLRARGLPRSLSNHGSGTSSLAPRPVDGDCPDHSPTTVQGLFSSATCDLDSHTVERHLFSLTLLQGSYFAFQQARGTFQHHTLLHLTLRPRVKPGPYKPFRMTCRLNRYN